MNGHKLQAIKLKILDILDLCNYYFKNGSLIDVFLIIMVFAGYILIVIKNIRMKK
jgi:hypothetical protein